MSTFVRFLDKSINLCALCFINQLCSSLCNPKDCSLPGTSVHGDSLGRNTVEWVSTPTSKVLMYHPSQQGVDHIFILPLSKLVAFPVLDIQIIDINTIHTEKNQIWRY